MEFPPYQSASASRIAEEAGAFAEKYGLLPNLSGLFADTPATLQELLAAMSAFDTQETRLSLLERQVVLLAVSVTYQCLDCTETRGVLPCANGQEYLELERLQHGRPLADPKLEALRSFSEAIAEYLGQLGQPEVQRFLTSGFTLAQTLEVIFGVALKTLANCTGRTTPPRSRT